MKAYAKFLFCKFACPHEVERLQQTGVRVAVRDQETVRDDVRPLEIFFGNVAAVAQDKGGLIVLLGSVTLPTFPPGQHPWHTGGSCKKLPTRTTQ